MANEHAPDLRRGMHSTRAGIWDFGSVPAALRQQSTLCMPLMWLGCAKNAWKRHWILVPRQKVYIEHYTAYGVSRFVARGGRGRSVRRDYCRVLGVTS